MFLINDEKMNKNLIGLKCDKIVDNIYQIIDDKFGFLKNDKYGFNLTVKVVDNPHLITYEINHLYEELLCNNYNNDLSIFNDKIFNRVLNEVKMQSELNKNKKVINIKINNPKMKLNEYEDYILKIIQNPELKQEVQNMINNKYSHLNIL